MKCWFKVRDTSDDFSNATRSDRTAARSRRHERRALNSNTFDDIHQLERAWPEALVNGDIDLLEEIWAQDFSLTTPDGTQIAREDCLAGLCGDEIHFELFDANAREVTIYGDNAVVRGSARVKCPRSLPDLNAAEHYVAIYSRRGDGWQQVAAIVTGAFRTKIGTRT